MCFDQQTTNAERLRHLQDFYCKAWIQFGHLDKLGWCHRHTLPQGRESCKSCAFPLSAANGATDILLREQEKSRCSYGSTLRGGTNCTRLTWKGNGKVLKSLKSLTNVIDIVYKLFWIYPGNKEFRHFSTLPSSADSMTPWTNFLLVLQANRWNN